MRVLTTNTAVEITPQLHADLRVAWKCLEDAGHDAAADRVFQFLNENGAYVAPVAGRPPAQQKAKMFLPDISPLKHPAGIGIEELHDFLETRIFRKSLFIGFIAALLLIAANTALMAFFGYNLHINYVSILPLIVIFCTLVSMFIFHSSSNDIVQSEHISRLSGEAKKSLDFYIEERNEEYFIVRNNDIKFLSYQQKYVKIEQCLEDVSRNQMNALRRGNV